MNAATRIYASVSAERRRQARMVAARDVEVATRRAERNLDRHVDDALAVVDESADVIEMRP